MHKKLPSGLVQHPEKVFQRTTRNVNYLLGIIPRPRFIQFCCCTLIMAVYIGLLSSPLLERFEYVVLDYFFRLRPPVTVDKNIAYIEIAEDSVQAIGRWPWPRHYHAVITHILSEWGAKAIIFDILFSEPSEASEDGAFAEAIQKADRLYLPVLLEPKGKEKIWIHNLPEFERHAKALGHINIIPDKDGTLRRIQPFLEIDGEKYSYIGVKVATDYLRDNSSEMREFDFPLDSKGDLLINWAGRWSETFAHYSFIDIIKSFQAVKKGKEPIISPDEIKDKIFFIGVTAAGHSDIKANPLESIYPAIGVQVNIFNSILQNKYIQQAPFSKNILALLLIGFIATFLFVTFRNVKSFLAGLVLGGAWVFIAYMFFVRWGVWFYVIHQLLLIFSLFIFSAIFTLILGKRERLRLFSLAVHDGLTNLFVIRHFRELLNKAFWEAKKREVPLSLMLFDIDHFKLVNDNFGHIAGDLILKEIAQLVQKEVSEKEPFKEANPVGRYGGEEFIVLLRYCDLTDAAFNFAEKIRKKIEETIFEHKHTKIPVTISVGVSTVHPNETVPDLMVHRADEALYRAKEQGRNRTCIEKV